MRKRPRKTTEERTFPCPICKGALVKPPTKLFRIIMCVICRSLIESSPDGQTQAIGHVDDWGQHVMGFLHPKAIEILEKRGAKAGTKSLDLWKPGGVK